MADRSTLVVPGLFAIVIQKYNKAPCWVSGGSSASVFSSKEEKGFHPGNVKLEVLVINTYCLLVGGERMPVTTVENGIMKKLNGTGSPHFQAPNLMWTWGPGIPTFAGYYSFHPTSYPGSVPKCYTINVCTWLALAQVLVHVVQHQSSDISDFRVLVSGTSSSSVQGKWR